MNKKKLRKLTFRLISVSVIGFCLIGAVNSRLKSFPVILNLINIALLVIISGSLLGAITAFILSLFTAEEKTHTSHSSESDTLNRNITEQNPNSQLINEIVIHKMPLYHCHGSVEVTDFIINIFQDRTEIIWGVGWCGGASHADGTGGKEILEADYFKKHTVEDFIEFLKSKSWSDVFLKKFDLKNNYQINKLFRQTADNYKELFTYRQLSSTHRASVLLNKNDNKAYSAVIKTFTSGGAQCDIIESTTHIEYQKAYELALKKQEEDPGFDASLYKSVLKD